MAEELPIAEPFSLELQWPTNPGRGGNALLDESIARFEILAAGKSLTAYETESGDKNSCLHIPTYYFVEWLALNWWSFLYEPRKSDREEVEQEFRSRHWLGAARNGFALPDVMFSPAGDKIEIVARSTFLRFAKLNFIENLTATVATESVRSEFSKFISEILARLSEKGLTESLAHEAWERVTQTTKEEEEYCRLIGSMGLYPYADHPEVDQDLEKIANRITQSMLTDLCEATSVGNFNRVVDLVENVSQVLDRAQPVRINELLKANKPMDTTQRAYEWGYRAADTARAVLDISHEDPSGAGAFFEKLKIDPSISESSDSSNGTILSGAVIRDNDDMRLSLVGTNKAQRKFAAARSAFLTWSGDKKSSKLVTSARTRDQQASRAFAAELLVPEKYLNKRLGNRTEISSFEVDKISEEMQVAPTVVYHQARNHGYHIAEAA